LFGDISGGGTPWLAVVDEDSGAFRLTGNGQDADSILVKLPNPDAGRSITRTYSQLQYYPAVSNLAGDPGRYMLLGRLVSSTVLEASVVRSFNYGMEGHWSCVACPGEGGAELRHGQLSGQLDVNIDNARATLDLSGDGLTLSHTLNLVKNSELSSTALPQITLDEVTITPVESRFLGGLFGPEAEEAGVLFGITDDQGSIFSGQAIGGEQ
jgi:hypothetical protein